MAIGGEINHLNPIAIDAPGRKHPAQPRRVSRAGASATLTGDAGEEQASVRNPRAPGGMSAALGTRGKSCLWPSLLEPELEVVG